jgi:hypothetical protein
MKYKTRREDGTLMSASRMENFTRLCTYTQKTTLSSTLGVVIDGPLQGKRNMADKVGLEMQGYERKVSTVMFINSTNINKTNDHFSS